MDVSITTKWSHEESNLSETSVRRLSLFDNISSNISNEIKVESEKTEPVILENASENISEIQEEEKLEKTD